MPKELPVVVDTALCSLNTKVTRSSTASELLNLVRNTVLLRELWYFGLQYEANGCTRYANLHKKVCSCDKSGSHQLKFRLRPRFYPEDVSELIEDITKSYFYQEVKDLIVRGEIHCPPETALLLASYQAVIRHHKYDPNIHKPGYLEVEKYIPAHILETHNLSKEEWAQKISNWHRTHGDMLEQDAIMEYLKIAQDLDMYGVGYFPVKKKNGTQLWLGVSPFGLTVYDYNNKLTGEVSFRWDEIRKLSFRGNKFSVKPKGPDAPVLAFYMGSTSECKDLLYTCTGHRNLHYRRHMSNDPIEVQQMKAQAKELQLARETERERLNAERLAREEAERRLLDMQRALQEQEMAFEKSQAKLTSYQQKVKELEDQLEEEKQARLELQAMQRRLEEVNERLERESAASVEERARLAAERDTVIDEIRRQRELISQQESEKLRLEAQVNEAKSLRNANGKSDSDEREVNFPDLQVTEELKDARVTADMDYAKQLDLLKKDLDAVKNRQKMQKVDILYEENLRQGMDKYRTLRQIRQGNTKERAEHFESL